MKKPTYYITTPIYYPSGNWHLGHGYTTVCCDALARYKRMRGYDVFYLTGTDEHGQKIEKRAAEAGATPQAFVDKLVSDIKRLWDKMDISYDKFIRTTDDYHVAAVQKIFTRLYEQGDIYKSTYKGKYCTPCEAYWTDSQLVDGKCPDCGREVGDAEEECYFFRLSKYQDRVRRLLTETDFLEPASRVKEMVNNFLEGGLTDLAVSRTSFSWGIPVPFDPGHVIYVWVDALVNYITALGYGSEDTALFDKYWPADLHLMAKEIVRFHTIVWPALLMALDIPLPKKVFGHGWLLFGGDKMSKSKGNVVDPFVLIDRYGVDAVRYYLLREIPFGADGVYTNEALLTRINADIVNDLGNLVRRTLAMSQQYFGGVVTRDGEAGEEDAAFLARIDGLQAAVDAQLDKPVVSRALETIFDAVGAANKYIDETKPWVLNKQPERRKRLERVIYNLLEALRVASALLKPFLTKYPDLIYAGLGLPPVTEFGDVLRWGLVEKYGTKEIPPLMPRLDIGKELSALEAIAAGEKTGGKPEAKPANQPEKNGPEKAKNPASDKAEKNKNPEETGMITIDEFFKTQLKVAEVTACEKVEKADKLLKLTLKVGEETRTVISGIAKSYTPEEMVGKQIVLVYNLKPAKLRGIESEGMILCATDGDKVVLVSPERVVDSGAEVC